MNSETRRSQIRSKGRVRREQGHFVVAAVVGPHRQIHEEALGPANIAGDYDMHDPTPIHPVRTHRTAGRESEILFVPIGSGESPRSEHSGCVECLGMPGHGRRASFSSTDGPSGLCGSSGAAECEFSSRTIHVPTRRCGSPMA